MTTRRRAVTATALGCGAALLAGAACTAAAAAGDPDGEGDLAGKSAQQISDDALHRLVSAKSLRLRTETTADPTKLDLTLDKAGNCAGAISKGELGRVEIIKRGNEVWMKPDAAFWKSQLPGEEGARAAAKYRNTFLHGTADHDAFLQNLATACDLTAFQKSAAGPGEPPPSGEPTPTSKLTKGHPTTHEGTPVLPVVKRTDGVTETLYVAIKGTHYPLKLTVEADEQKGTVLLSNYGTPVPDKTPAPGDTADISALEDLFQGTHTA
ncbi:hypothetical protein ACWCXK_12215 [Streptomyces sp. NPDC001739]|uniref:hypothetical protein n=1 Tax=Streptomyces sp. NPDC001657 TaxID=3154522 RepID=UPI0033168EE4